MASFHPLALAFVASFSLAVVAAQSADICCACSRGTDSGSDLVSFEGADGQSCDSCCSQHILEKNYEGGKAEPSSLCSNHGSHATSASCTYAPVQAVLRGPGDSAKEGEACCDTRISPNRCQESTHLPGCANGLICHVYGEATWKPGKCVAEAVLRGPGDSAKEGEACCDTRISPNRCQESTHLPGCANGLICHVYGEATWKPGKCAPVVYGNTISAPSKCCPASMECDSECCESQSGPWKDCINKCASPPSQYPSWKQCAKNPGCNAECCEQSPGGVKDCMKQPCCVTPPSSNSTILV